MPAIITIPKNQVTYPMVIFIHGSGPNDKDETVGPNKPFRDIAHGLAKYNIASLRFDKRTFVYGKKFTERGKNPDINQEVLQDAKNAVRFASQLKAVDKIYILGHSLGGMLAPKMASENEVIDGIILMAGNARPLARLILEQYQYLLSLDGLSDQDEKQLSELRFRVDNLAKLKLNPTDSLLKLPLNLPNSCWCSLLQYNQVEEIQTVKVKILLLQGERDYQVTMEDFRLWQAALKDNESATFKSYPKLNHLFLEGEGPSLPSEYQQQGSIPAYVLKDISDWILDEQ